MEASQSPKTRKGRSPRYPGIALDLAVERTRQLWEKERIYDTNVQTALAHWGYAPKSGGGAVAIAALKSFGLIQDSGSGDARTVRLTERAQQILLSDDPMQVRSATQEAALAPTIHRDLWDRYGPQLPSDQSLKLYLLRERGFTPTGADDLVSEYKRTIAFARLAERSTSPSADTPLDVAAEPDDASDAGSNSDTAPAPVYTASLDSANWNVLGSNLNRYIARPTIMTSSATILEIPVPLAGEGYARISLPASMSQRAWNQLMSVLEAYKPGIVTPAEKFDVQLTDVGAEVSDDAVRDEG